MSYMRFLFPLLFAFQQVVTAQKGHLSITNGYISIKNRTEVQITPLLDTLVAGQEYVFEINFNNKYVFSELFMDKGVAFRSLNTLTIKPINKKNSVDTATLRIIGFSSNNRVLLFHQFFVEPEKNIYPKLSKKQIYILIDNNTLERNSTYKRDLFTRDATFSYYEQGLNDSVVIKGLTLSLVSGKFRRNLYTTKPSLTREMFDEIKSLKQNTLAYIRLDILINNRRKSTWTRFTIIP